MEKKVRCQSCGMPLAKDFFGTNIDGGKNEEYCNFCFQNGVFTEPDLTLRAMIDKSIRHMTRTLNLGEEQADVLANSVIPTLKRWQRT